MMQANSRRAGFTLVETLVALTLLGALIAVTLSAMDRQMKLFSTGSAQMDAIQNGRFAMSVLEKDIPTLGTNVAPQQPFLVYADSAVIAFNADYLSNRLNDVSAIYVDTTASDLYATAVMRARRFTIPRSVMQYPDSNYHVGGQNSPAETITFFFVPDTATTRTDDYLLYRQVNNNQPDEIARGILRIPGVPLLQYQRRVTPASGNPYMQQVTTLPLRHTRPLHGSVSDTGSYAVIDSIRSVTVNFRVTDGQPGMKERIYNVTRTIALPNAGLGTRQTCGDEPIFGAAFSATAVSLSGTPAVRLSWTAATDESSGEKDVVRYVIYRNTAGGLGAIADPFLSIPAGQVSYVYDDATVTPGIPYYYWIAAQDCTPSLSQPTAAAPVIP